MMPTTMAKIGLTRTRSLAMLARRDKPLAPIFEPIVPTRKQFQAFLREAHGRHPSRRSPTERPTQLRWAKSDRGPQYFSGFTVGRWPRVYGSQQLHRSTI